MPHDFRKKISQLARPKTIEVGNFVSFESLGQQRSGRVLQVFTSGVIRPKAGQVAYPATEMMPVIELEVHNKVGDEYQPTGEKIIRPAHSCQSIADARRAVAYHGVMAIQRTDDVPAELVIYSDIGGYDWFSDETGATAAKVREELAKIKSGRAIDLRINSPGGDAFEGMAIYNILAQHAKKTGAKITAYNDGIVASAATVIAMAAGEIIAGQQSIFMIHRGFTIALGNRNDLMKSVEMLDRIDGQTADLYHARVKSAGKDYSREDVMAWVDAETYYDANEQVSYGFADSVFETRDKVSASYGAQRPWMHKLPDQLRQRFAPPDPSRVPFMERAEAA
jgi:ATP-dependent Clp protease protease subunit